MASGLLGAIGLALRRHSDDRAVIWHDRAQSNGDREAPDLRRAAPRDVDAAGAGS